MVQSMNYGGMERVIADLISHTDPDRFDLDLLCLDYLGRFSEGLERVATLHVAVPMSRLSIVNPSGLTGQIRDIAPDIVHTHSGVWYKGSLAARKAGVPTVVHTEHGRRSPDPMMDRLFDGIAARRTDVVVAVSELLMEDLPYRLRMPQEKVVCIPNGIDTDLFCPRSDTGRLRRELGVSPTTPIIGSIGRLESIKAYDLMLTAFAGFLGTDAGRNAHLVVAGEGATRPQLEQLVSQLGVSARVHMVGWRDDVQDLLSAFSLFTMSSRSEGTSISLLEAMSMGIPPVVTAVGGNAFVLGPDLAHFLVPFGDPAALASAWQTCLAGPVARTKLGERARRRVEQCFGLRTMARAYEALYERFVGRPDVLRANLSIESGRG
jgi:glycosyltransferase involved in cell wall biosynthesis